MPWGVPCSEVMVGGLDGPDARMRSTRGPVMVTGVGGLTGVAVNVTSTSPELGAPARIGTLRVALVWFANVTIWSTAPTFTPTAGDDGSVLTSTCIGT